MIAKGSKQKGQTRFSLCLRSLITERGSFLRLDVWKIDGLEKSRKVELQIADFFRSRGNYIYPYVVAFGICRKDKKALSLRIVTQC